MADEKAADQEADAPAKKKSLLPMILIGLVVLGAAGGGAWYFLLAPGGEADAEGSAEEAEAEHGESHGEPLYFTLADNLVVNFRATGGARFLQVGIDVMTYDADGAHALEVHAPVLQSNLIMLLGDQTQAELLTREGKEALRDEALAEIRHSMEELHGSPVVESVFFTNFVMQ